MRLSTPGVSLAHDLVKRVEKISTGVVSDCESIFIHAFDNGLHLAATAIRKASFPSLLIAWVDDRSNERFQNLEHQRRGNRAWFAILERQGADIGTHDSVPFKFRLRPPRFL